MAHVLRKSSNNSKGVILFTHKEWPFLEQVFWALGSFRKQFKEKYLIGVHWGCYKEGIESKYQDFNLISKGMATFKTDNNNIIELSSKNFLPKEIKKTNIEKQWDIINISRPKKFKKLIEFLDCIRLLYDRKKFVKVLLICGTTKEFGTNKTFDNDIYDRYLKMFSYEEREHFTFLFLRSEGHPKNIPSSTIAHFLNSSKIFTIFSHMEGPNKSIHEALLCGLPVVLNEKYGKYLTYLNSTNSVFYKDVEDAANIFTKILDNYDEYTYDVEPYEKELSEVYTNDVLKKEILKVFPNEKLNFDSDTNFKSLSFNLIGLVKHLPRWMRQPETNDLNSVFSSFKYLNNILKS